MSTNKVALLCTGGGVLVVAAITLAAVESPAKAPRASAPRASVPHAKRSNVLAGKFDKGELDYGEETNALLGSRAYCERRGLVTYVHVTVRNTLDRSVTASLGPAYRLEGYDHSYGGATDASTYIVFLPPHASKTLTMNGGIATQTVWRNVRDRAGNVVDSVQREVPIPKSVRLSKCEPYTWSVHSGRPDPVEEFLLRQRIGSSPG